MSDPVLIAALRRAEDALREFACHAGPNVPCLRSPEQCRDQCGEDAGDALIAVLAALASTKDTKKGSDNG